VWTACKDCVEEAIAAKLEVEAHPPTHCVVQPTVTGVDQRDVVPAPFALPAQGSQKVGRPLSMSMHKVEPSLDEIEAKAGTKMSDVTREPPGGRWESDYRDRLQVEERTTGFIPNQDNRFHDPVPCLRTGELPDGNIEAHSLIAREDEVQYPKPCG
jgi:hypothetical protein